jgi:signal transduction histidine kinase
MASRLPHTFRSAPALEALLDDLRAAQRRAVAAEDAERQRIERDLHDGAQQRLMAMRLELGLLAERLEEDHRPVTRQDLDRLRGAVEEALGELRELAHGLRPPLLASDGLQAALVAASRRGPVPVEVVGSDVGRLDAAAENAAYFCCMEALQNVAKHAGNGARAVIRLEAGDGALRFTVTDDGRGFDPGRDVEGHGLTNLRDRLGALGGHAEVTSVPGRGTIIFGHIPLAEPARAGTSAARDAGIPVLREASLTVYGRDDSGPGRRPHSH